MTIKNLVRGFFLYFLSLHAFGQNFNRDIEFLNHLGSIKAYEEAIHYADRILPTYQSTIRRDSVHFLKGKYYYEQKRIPKAISSFASVSSNSLALSESSEFYLAFLQAYQRDFEASLKQLASLAPERTLRLELKQFELASTHLLLRDLHKFDSLSATFSYDYYQLEDYERDMIGLSKALRKHKQKSPFVAGLLSAIVPGAGRYYQGKIGQGTIGLVSTGVFAMQALEAYHKDGVKSPRFVIFGGLLSAFYIANIWGSAVSVRVNEMRYNEDVDEAILVNMHLPIRLLFD